MCRRRSTEATLSGLISSARRKRPSTRSSSQSTTVWRRRRCPLRVPGRVRRKKVLSGGRVGVRLGEPREISRVDRSPVHHAAHAPPGRHLKALHRLCGHARPCGVLHDGPAQGVLRGGFQGQSKTEEIRLGHFRGGSMRSTRGRQRVTVSVLSRSTTSTAFMSARPRRSGRERPFGGHARAHHERRGCGEPERTGAGDDQRGEGSRERPGEDGHVRRNPGRRLEARGDEGANTSGRKKSSAKESADRTVTTGTDTEVMRSAKAWMGTSFPGLLDEGDDLGEEGLRADAGDPDAQKPSRLMVAPVTASPALRTTGSGSPEIMDSSMLLVPPRSRRPGGSSPRGGRASRRRGRALHVHLDHGTVPLHRGALGAHFKQFWRSLRARVRAPSPGNAGEVEAMIMPPTMRSSPRAAGDLQESRREGSSVPRVMRVSMLVCRRSIA
jgi:hypothetical protein